MSFTLSIFFHKFPARSLTHRGIRKRKQARGGSAFTKEELDEFEEDARLLKKLKRGKITEEECDDMLLAGPEPKKKRKKKKKVEEQKQ